jgi:hypothetical protein
MTEMTGEGAMCLSLLKKLAATPLPCSEPDPALIDRLRLLDAAGHLRVLIPPPHVDCDDRMRQDPATVLEITPRGWAALRTDIPDDEVSQPANPPARHRPESSAIDLAQLAAWFSDTRHRSGG